MRRTPPQSPSRGENASAFPRYFCVVRAGNSLLVFVRSAAGENKMCMRIHKPRKNDATTGIHFRRVTCFRQGLYFPARACGGDLSAGNKHGSTANHPRVAKRRAAPRYGAAQGYDLVEVREQQACGHRAILRLAAGLRHSFASLALTGNRRAILFALPDKEDLCPSRNTFI